MKKFILIFTIMIIAVSGRCVYADDDAVKAEIAAVENDIKTTENEINSLEAEKTSKSKELVDANANLKALQDNINTLQASIDENTVILNEAETQMANSFNVFSERLMSMYEQGSNAYLSVILGTENIFDMFDRINLITEISEHDKDVYLSYKENKETIENKQNELTAAKAELEKQTAEFEAFISSKNTELESIVSALKEKKSTLSSLNAKVSSLNTSLGSMEYADQIFKEAEKYLGMPYVFGGSTPETSFDCSGFVCYAVTHSGVYNLPRTTAQGIYNQCLKISPSEAKRGDIIFFQGTYNAGETVTHVGFYAGDGKMLHCGNPIQYTSMQTSYWQSHFYAFGRLKK